MKFLRICLVFALLVVGLSARSQTSQAIVSTFDYYADGAFLMDNGLELGNQIDLNTNVYAIDGFDFDYFCPNSFLSTNVGVDIRFYKNNGPLDHDSYGYFATPGTLFFDSGWYYNTPSGSIPAWPDGVDFGYGSSDFEYGDGPGAIIMPAGLLVPQQFTYTITFTNVDSVSEVAVPLATNGPAGPGSQVDDWYWMKYDGFWGAYLNETAPANLLLFGFTGVAEATPTNFTWTGSVNSDWFNSGNWSPAGVPGTYDTINFSGGTIDLSSPVSFSGQFNWSGGSLEGSPLTVALTGELHIEGSVSLYCALTNAGTVDWTGTGDLQMVNGGGYTGGINNLTGAMFNAQNDQAINGTYGGEYFNNAGWFQKWPTTTNTTTVNVPFNNTGEIVAQSGTILLQNGGHLGGIFWTASGAAIVIGGGSFDWDGTAVYRGLGTVAFTGGNLAITGETTNVVAGNVTVSGLSNIVGTAWLTNCTINSQETVVGIVNWSGTLNAGSSLTVATTGFLNLVDDSVVYGVLTNAGTLTWTNSGDLGVYAGTETNCTGIGSGACLTNCFDYMGAIVNQSNAVLNLNGNGSFFLDGILNNSGMVNALGWCRFEIDNVAGTNYYTNDFGGYDCSYFNYRGGIVNCTNGVLNIDTDDDICLDAVLTNAGTINWDSLGEIRLFNGTCTDGIPPHRSVFDYTAGIVNLAGAVFNIQNDGTVYDASNPGSSFFENYGSVPKVGGLFAAYIEVPFFNQGSVASETGQMVFEDGGTVAGDFQAATGSGIFFNDGTFGLNSAAVLQGPGVVEFGNVNLALSGSFTNFTLTGSIGEEPSVSGLSNIFGSADLTNCAIGDTETIYCTLNWAGGQIASAASLTVASNAVLNLSGNIALYGALTNEGTMGWNGSGNLQVYNGAGTNEVEIAFEEYEYSYFDYTGSIVNESNALLNLGGDGSVYFAGALTNAGTVNWTGARDIQMYNGPGFDFYYDDGAHISEFGYNGGIVNLPGAVFNIATDEAIYYDEEGPPASYFNNAGTLEKTAGFGTTYFDVIINNTGTVTVNNGVIDFLDGGNLDGEFQAAADAAIYFDEGNFAWNSTAVFQGSGNVQFNDDANVTLSGTFTNFSYTGGTIAGLSNVVGTINLAYCSIADAETISGTLNLVSGGIESSGSLTVASNGVLNITEGADLYGVLTNAGTANWACAGEIDIYNDRPHEGGIVNLAGAVFNIQNDQAMVGHFGSEYFDNAGTVVKSPGTHTTTFDLAFNNTGFVDAESGTILFNDGGWVAGDYEAATNAAIYFSGGVYSLNADTGFQGPGTEQITNATITLTGPFTNICFADVDISGLSNVLGTASLTNCYVQDAASITTMLNLSGGGISADCSIYVASNAVANISGNLSFSGVLTNAGTINWAGTNDLEVDNFASHGSDGAIVNLAGAVFNIQNDQGIDNDITGSAIGDDGHPYFDNAGTVLKTAGTNTTTINILFNNTGAVDVENGTILIKNGGLMSGCFRAAAGAGINFSGGDYSWYQSTTVQGPGFVQFTGGTVALEGVITNVSFSTAFSPELIGLSIFGLNNVVGTINLTNCWIVGGQTLGGKLNWSGGGIANGFLTVASNGVLNLGGTIYLDGGITNAGEVNWEGTNDLEVLPFNTYYPGSIVNLAGAVFNIQNDQTIYVWSDQENFDNAGTVIKTGGGGTTTINLAFNNSGTVEAESGTILLNNGGLAAGDYQAATGAVVNFNGGNYVWNSATTLEGPGNVELTGVSLELTGTFTDVGFTNVSVTGISNVVGTIDLNNCNIDGADTVVGTLDWSGQLGNFCSLTVESNAVLNIDGALTLYGPLTNCGTVNWTGTEFLALINYLHFEDLTGGIVNQAGAVFNILSDTPITIPLNVNSPAYFNNAGTILKTGGFNTNTFNAAFTNTGTVDVEMGAINFNNGGSLAGTFEADTNGAMFFVGGLFDLTEPVMQGFGSIAVSGGSLTGTVGNALNWLSGQIDDDSMLTVVSNSVLNIEGMVSLSGPLVNAGTVNWSGTNDLQVDNDGNDTTGGITNQAGATFNIENGQTVDNLGYGYFDNAGTVLKSAGNDTTIFEVAFNNTGAVEVNSGTILFEGGGFLGGNFEANARCEIYFNGGTNSVTYDLGGATVFTGPGTVQFAGGDFVITSTVTNLAYGGGTLYGLTNVVGFADLTNCTIGDAATVLGTLNWSGGGISSAGSLTVASDAVMNLTGDFSFSGPLTNAGTLNWTGTGDLTFQFGAAQLDNLSGAVFNIQNDQSMLAGDAGQIPYFNNEGTVLKTGGTNTTACGLSFNSSGDLEIESGAFDFDGGGNFANSLQVANDSEVILSGGTFTETTACTNTFTMIGGALTGPWTLAGTFNWDGGGINCSTLTVADTGWLNLETNGAIQAVLVVNNGTVQKSGGTNVVSFDGFFNNAGTLSVETGGVAMYGGGIVGGDLQVATNSGIYYNSGSFLENDTTTIQGTGSVFLAGGTVTPLPVAIGLTNGNSTVQVNPLSQNGMSSWVVDGTNQLAQHWFWLGHGTNVQTSVDQLGLLYNLSSSPTNLVMNYLAQGLVATVEFSLMGGSDGSLASDVVETVTVTNTASFTDCFHVFSFSDFDLAGAAGGDSISTLTTNQVVQAGKNMMVTTTHGPASGMVTNEFESSWYAMTMDKLIAGAPAILADAATPVGAGDQTFAYQWDFSLNPGQVFQLSLTNSIRPSP